MCGPYGKQSPLWGSTLGSAKTDSIFRFVLAANLWIWRDPDRSTPKPSVYACCNYSQLTCAKLRQHACKVVSPWYQTSALQHDRTDNSTGKLTPRSTPPLAIDDSISKMRNLFLTFGIARSYTSRQIQVGLGTRRLETFGHRATAITIK